MRVSTVRATLQRGELLGAVRELRALIVVSAKHAAVAATHVHNVSTLKVPALIHLQRRRRLPKLALDYSQLKQPPRLSHCSRRML